MVNKGDILVRSAYGSKYKVTGINNGIITLKGLAEGGKYLDIKKVKIAEIGNYFETLEGFRL